MAVRTHYDVLGVAPGASVEAIRAAYRRRARDHHPDRQASSSAAGADMPAINEAYRVLSDPGRRALYDRSLGVGTATPSASAGGDMRTPPRDEPYPSVQHGPARVPWRMLLLCGSLAIVGIIVLAQFAGSGEQLGPDGILRNGDCVEIEADGDAREVACTDDGDLVVRAFVPFDGTCPGSTTAHRDRQGMGVACVAAAPTD